MILSGHLLAHFCKLLGVEVTCFPTLNLALFTSTCTLISMKYHELLFTSSPLSRHALCIWQLQGHGETVAFRHIPKCQSMLMFHYGEDTLVQIDKRTFTIPPVFVMPIVSTSTQAQLANAELLGISFINDGLYRLFQSPVSQLALGIPQPYHDRLHLLWHTLKGKHLREAYELLESFLNEAMTFTPSPLGFDRALTCIANSNGCLSVQELCREAAISERSLQRHFRERIGISPKRFSKITRVNAYLKQLLEQKEQDWMQAVVSFNYHDQPHLVNEFKSIIQLSPRDLMKFQDSLYQQLE